MIDYREDARWTVYVHIVPREISGYDHEKYYVGITSKSKPTQRWENGYGYRGNKHFYNAIEKYGWHNIQHELVATHLTCEEAKEMEKTLIQLLQAQNPRYGYNKTSGGDGTCGIKMSKREKRLRSEKLTGVGNPFYGQKHSEETRKTMSKNHYDCAGGNNPRARRIHQFDSNWNYISSYPSAKDAGEALGSSDAMGRAAIHQRKHYGFYWVFDDNITTDEYGDIHVKCKFNTEPERGLPKEVFQFNTDGHFISKYSSCTNVEKEIGIKSYAVGKAARGEVKFAGGFIWKYRKDVIERDGSFFIA